MTYRKLLILLVLCTAPFTDYFSCHAEEVKRDSTARRPINLSIRTNLLWDGLSEPNIGIEYALSKRWSIGANAGIKVWPRWLAWDWDYVNPKHWRNFAVVPEARYYFDQIYDGWFAGADAVYTHFNVGAVGFPIGTLYPDVRDYRLQGSYWAGGLFGGYAWWPWQHWRIEVEAGAAVGLAAYDRYDCPHCGSKLGEERKVAVVPKLGINVAYNTVSKEELARRREALRKMVAGTDTLTVFTPPVAFVVQLKEVKAPETAGDRLAKRNNWVIPIEEYRPLDWLTRPGRDSILYVQYPVDSYQLQRDFGHNGATLELMEQAVQALDADARIGELLISVVGLASIEGPQERNDSLSVRRARAVADELSSRTGLSRRLFETIGKGEAWDWFKAQIAAGPEGFSGAEIGTLQAILDLPDADLRERKLRSEAPLYQKVKDLLLADQRNAGYIRVYYGSKPDLATEQLNGPIRSLLEQRRYHDALRAIEGNPAVMARIQSDPEALNAYAVALYFTALDNGDESREQQALQLLEEAVRNGSVCAGKNLEGAAVYGPARKEYEAWMKTIKEENE